MRINLTKLISLVSMLTFPYHGPKRLCAMASASDVMGHAVAATAQELPALGAGAALGSDSNSSSPCAKVQLAPRLQLPASKNLHSTVL